MPRTWCRAASPPQQGPWGDGRGLPRAAFYDGGNRANHWVQRMADFAQVAILINRNTKMNRQTTSPLADVADGKRRNRVLGKRWGSEEGPNRAIGLTGYSLASCTDAGREITPPEICDAIRNATTMAGTLISLRNWSTESIVVVPQGNFKSPSAKAAAKRRFNPPFAWSADRLSEAGPCRPPRKS